MKPEGDPRHSGSWPASHAPAKAPPHKECAGGKTVSLEHWENQQECPSHTSVIVQWGTESLIPPCTVSINKKKKKKPLAPCGLSVPWVLSREWLAMTNLISEGLDRPGLNI